MKELFGRRIWIILLALAALIGLIILASGLKELKFDPPQWIGLENIFNFSNDVIHEDTSSVSWIRNLLLGMFILIFLLFLVPIRPRSSKDLIKMIVRFILIAFVIIMVLGRFAQKIPLLNEDIANTSGTGSSSGPQIFSPPVVNSTWEFWIAAVIVIFISVILYVVFNRFIDRWLQPRKGLDEFADIARSTLNDLSEIKVSKNTIIRCYIRMNSAVNEYRGITREAAMTPAEFAQNLEKAGLPRDGVQGLTRVFEKVRYGAQNINPEEIKEAKQCLTSILKACKVQL